jgi:hypothetical protein
MDRSSRSGIRHRRDREAERRRRRVLRSRMEPGTYRDSSRASPDRWCGSRLRKGVGQTSRLEVNAAVRARSPSSPTIRRLLFRTR